MGSKKQRHKEKPRIVRTCLYMRAPMRLPIRMSHPGEQQCLIDKPETHEFCPGSPLTSVCDCCENTSRRAGSCRSRTRCLLAQRPRPSRALLARTAASSPTVHSLRCESRTCVYTRGRFVTSASNHRPWTARSTSLMRAAAPLALLHMQRKGESRQRSTKAPACPAALRAMR